jgi:hypothetical protein
VGAIEIWGLRAVLALLDDVWSAFDSGPNLACKFLTLSNAESAPPLPMRRQLKNLIPRRKEQAQPVPAPSKQHLLSMTGLLEWRVETKDGYAAAVRDLLIDTRSWRVPLLVIDPGGPLSPRQLLVPTDIIGQLDDTLKRFVLNTDAATLRIAPRLVPAGDDFAIVGRERLSGEWQTAWERLGGAGPDLVGAPPPAGHVGGESANGIDYGRDLIRFGSLRRYIAQTADEVRLPIRDLLLSVDDWAIGYLDLEVCPDPAKWGHSKSDDASGCLVTGDSIDWINPDGDVFNLAVWASELADAELQPHPLASEGQRPVKILSRI